DCDSGGAPQAGYVARVAHFATHPCPELAIVATCLTVSRPKHHTERLASTMYKYSQRRCSKIRVCADFASEPSSMITAFSWDPSPAVTGYSRSTTCAIMHARADGSRGDGMAVRDSGVAWGLDLRMAAA